MTAQRLISLPLRGAIEMFGGLALMAAPFVLGFGLAATVFGVVLGVLVVGPALQSVDDGRPTRYRAHRDADLALGGLVLNRLTRYAPRRGVTRIQNFPQ